MRGAAAGSGCLVFTGAGMLDGSPLIDIKPFFGPVDNQPDAVSGWLESKRAGTAEIRRSDSCFT